MARVTQDTIISLPPNGGICRVELPTASGGREIYHCTPQTVGTLLAGLTDEAQNVRWIDLLGATEPGMALTHRRGGLYMALSFPARRKMVRVRDFDDPVPFNLPPTVWVLQFHVQHQTLQQAWFFATPTRVTSVADTIPAMHFPWGNVYHPHGNVCWGNVTWNTLTSADPIAVDNLFFSTGFNADLSNVGLFLRPDGTSFTDYGAWVRWQANHPDEALTLRFDGHAGFQSRLRSCLREG